MPSDLSDRQVPKIEVFRLIQWHLNNSITSSDVMSDIISS